MSIDRPAVCLDKTQEAPMRSNLAGLGPRIVALLVDTIILGIIGGIIAGITGSGGVGSFAGFLVGLAYNWYFWTRQNGQTPGKMLMGIRVVRVDGRRMEDITAFVRYVGYYVNTFLILIGWIWAIFDDRNQGFHDKLAGTVVVQA
jgi:uncharacterized RDD family membrane protein YckC